MTDRVPPEILARLIDYSIEILILGFQFTPGDPFLKSFRAHLAQKPLYSVRVEKVVERAAKLLLSSKREEKFKGDDRRVLVPIVCLIETSSLISESLVVAERKPPEFRADVIPTSVDPLDEAL